jgi:tetratricopeptide (TPR) repeat protein
VTSPDRQGAFTALGEGRQTLAHLDRARGPEDTAADIIDLWNSAENALRALAGQEGVSGQQLVRVARQGEIISLEQAHALLEFLAARDRVNRTTYTPTPGDSEAARAGFRAIETAASGNPPAAAQASPYAASSSPYDPASKYAPPFPGAVPYMRTKAAQDALASKQNIPYEGPSATPPGGYSVAATPGDRWRGTPLWVKIGALLLVILLIAGGYYLVAGRNSAQSQLNAGITAMQNGQRELARQDFANAARQDDKLAEPHIFLARLSREDGDLATARAQLDEALRLEPKNHVALREMGLVMFASKNYDVARRFFVRAANADPTDRAALGYLGCALSRLGRTVEAAKFLSSAGNGAWSACAQQPQVLSPPL